MHWAEQRWFGGWDEMHKLRLNQPEEDDGFFVYTFLTEAIFLLFLHVDELWEAGFHDALPPAKRRKVMAFYRSCLQRRLYVSGRNKTIPNQGHAVIRRGGVVAGVIPGREIHHDCARPLQSRGLARECLLAGLAGAFPSPEKDGPEAKAYARLAVRWFQHLFDFREKVSPRHYYCIDYRDLSTDPKGTIERVYQHFGWKMSAAFREKLTQAAGEEKNFESNHSYSLERIRPNERMDPRRTKGSA